MKPLRLLFAVLAIGLSLAAGACDDESATAKAVKPVEPGPDDLGHYCGMIVNNHSGPKGHIFLTDSDKPVWFSSVRDTLAYTKLPEEPKNIAAIFVNDMGRATNWDHPEPGTWVRAREAVFVVGSDARGGMGAPAIVPFGDRAAAEAFAERHGGRLLEFEDITQDMVLGPADGGGVDAATGGGSHDSTQ